MEKATSSSASATISRRITTRTAPTRLGPTLDLHYAYLVGFADRGGWPDWNPNGTFVDVVVTSANAHGVTPMFTLYAMAGGATAT